MYSHDGTICVSTEQLLIDKYLLGGIDGGETGISKLGLPVSYLRSVSVRYMSHTQIEFTHMMVTMVFPVRFSVMLSSIALPYTR